MVSVGGGFYEIMLIQIISLNNTFLLTKQNKTKPKLKTKWKETIMITKSKQMLYISCNCLILAVFCCPFLRIRQLS